MNIYKGIDVSKWQGAIDWNLVKQSGVQFAMIRCGFGYGEGQEDVNFEYNYTNAKKAGINVGAYHYSYATSVESAIKEADYCYSIIKDKKFEYPIAYDVEENRIAELGKETVSKIVDAFCRRMEEYGYYVCVYANKYWLDNYFTEEIFKRYDIWLAQWAEKPTFDKPYGMWQKTSSGRVDGIRTNVDLDEAYKNYPAIMKYNGLNGFGKNIEVRPPEEGFNAGQRVILNKTPLYATATSERVANYLSGAYYIYDGKNIAGRYRITNSPTNVERKPIGQYVTGFVSQRGLEG